MERQVIQECLVNDNDTSRSSHAPKEGAGIETPPMPSHGCGHHDHGQHDVEQQLPCGDDLFIHEAQREPEDHHSRGHDHTKADKGLFRHVFGKVTLQEIIEHHVAGNVDNRAQC